MNNRTLTPLVTIGMPVFNGERYIEESITAILNQTYIDFELIISDNASTDATPEIIENFIKKDSRIRYYRNHTNLGAAKNYNRLVEHSKGDYFKWAAADDVILPSMVERCLETLVSHPGAVLTYPRTRLIGENGEFLFDFNDGFHIVDEAAHTRFKAFFNAPFLCNPVFGLIRTDILNKTALIGGYASSDRVLLGELILHGKFYEVEETLFFHRIHPEKSTERHPEEHEFALWFNPELKGKLSFPRWRRLLEYSKGINRAPLSRPERFRCYQVLGKFILNPYKWIGLFGDFIRAPLALTRAK